MKGDFHVQFCEKLRVKIPLLTHQRKKEPQKVLKISDDTIDIRSARKTWAMLIHRVYEVDPLLCPECVSEMKIIAFIQARSEIIKILKHLNLYPTKKPEPIKEIASRLFLPEASHTK